ncbi:MULTISPECIES: hypothetical protein [unclassified Pseudomonas]|uniref:hypothetical protein n=1 Tax=unclassified Pseudomonas TaxID=196821 RepID=UPI002B23CF77|nr:MULTISPECIES: hypothetical protein [unclassified Pseudomonas]MEA9994560.1 hypothetical protein [Pseudomonas sp. AA4]MEB0085705.1 hypothetical protein [Pseudomonas sp. RTI1]MEB0125970.1 hypothetical protein [Pseudomonas sp. CCC1.2]MEB0152774.1 hypothetical protein [Pseudomonas sp. CCC4.3]MEB0221279.1 hypothetical protein [Pseudomonas sp. AB12(2023)]
MSDYSKLKELAAATEGWQKLFDCWPERSEDGDLDMNWFVGSVNEDGEKYPVLEVNTDQYDAPEGAGRLARFYAAANPAVVLGLLAEIERLRNLAQSEINSSSESAKEVCGARITLNAMQQERDQLNAECEESAAVIDSLAKILAGVAVVLKGEELPLHRHGYHDLVERVTVLKLENDLREAECEGLRVALSDSREFIMHEAKVRCMLVGNGDVSHMFPRRKALIAQIDGAMGRGEWS